ncbi:hypothetical protein [Puia sp.]|uniref:DUF4339 domain-containing protein n=1 Tax=Puia sp. TaxID=2045100 RepID=UPI002F40CE85
MYLLLRNNKQSGPYSLDELKSMGLKAYDLVWLEGKSAAWRYPGELEELSSFAPPVEEQPFDRFYKKPAASANAGVPVNAAVESTVSTTTSLPPIVPAATPAAASPQYAGEPSAVPGKRIIYVTMPAGRTSSPSRETPREVANDQRLNGAPVRETPKEPVRPVTVAGAPDPEHVAYASGVTHAGAATPAGAAVHARPAAEDYSSQLPSLEEQLEAVSPRSRSMRSKRILRPLGIGLVILALLAAGIFIGISLAKDNPALQQKIASKNAAQNTAQPIIHPASQQLPAAATIPASPAGVTGEAKDSVAEIVEQPVTTVPPVTKPTHPATSKQRPATPKKGVIPPPVTKDSAAGANSALHREAVHRADIIETKSENKVDKPARTPIASQVSVGANGYAVGTFGGINDLQLTVTNRSVYPLDLVVVEVQYIQANKKVYKTENLYFRNIGAGSALMQEAPKSTRGIKVQYKITTISSKDLGLSYSGI